MSSPRPRIARWKLLLLVFVVLFIIVVTKIGCDLYQMVHTKIPESYASWTVGNVMVEYLQTHTNQWPRSWEDLRSVTNSIEQKEVGSCNVYTPFERLPEFLKIDWRVDPEHLLQVTRRNANATIHVVTRLDGSRPIAVWGSDTEPNAKILRYLKTTLTISNALEPIATVPLDSTNK